MPPGPKRVFDIIEGKRIMFSNTVKTWEKLEWVKNEELGIETPLKSIICIHSSHIKNVLKIRQYKRRNTICKNRLLDCL